MAASGLSSEPSQEVFSWLKSLPLAPEYRPTLAEFQDPIAYIFKIEKEASQYGICKIVPPVPPAPRKAAIANLNRSLLARAAATSSSDSKPVPTFTTRQQQIGFCPRKPRPVQKPVWQSGEYYTFQEFEAKAKNFERSYLKKCTRKGSLSALEVETLYWKATVDKPFSVEYANDMPGSAFVPVSSKRSSGGGREPGEGMTVGETAWNMRGVSRANGSLLRFMKEEIPGVTSPMVYIAMLFSWFAWHVEDHDLHSLNYLHMGAGKTWYGVPRDAAVAFEEVVRVHGYGGEINPLVTFATLGEKTTVMSPEVFLSAGIPCCRLVQNAGEFVVTFPRAYHSGFSHGFNCGEAANIATPEWLRVAQDAAIRRASINYPPMVSHFQLLYDLALELCSRVPMSITPKPKSSRLKDKNKSEGETLVKELFVQNIIQNNGLLNILGKGSSVVLLPESSSDISICSDLRVGSQLRVNSRISLGLCNYKEVMKSSQGRVSDEIMLSRNQEIKPVKGFYSVKGKLASLYEGNRDISLGGNNNMPSQIQKTDNEGEGIVQGDTLSDQRLFSCVTCGLLSFACVAIIQPREPTSRHLMSVDCSFFNDWTVGSGVSRDRFTSSRGNAVMSEQNSHTSAALALYDVPVQSIDCQVKMVDQSNEMVSDTERPGDNSALGLLALTYGNSSDSEDHAEPNIAVSGDETNSTNCSPDRKYGCSSSGLPPVDARLDSGDEAPMQMKSNGFDVKLIDPVTGAHTNSSCSPVSHVTDNMKFNKAIVPIENADTPFAPRSDEDSSRMHIFCLEHAVEVEQQLRPIGGVHVFLLCHPEYPKIEAEAKSVAEELGIGCVWNDISFRKAMKEDEDRIKLALDSEEAIPGNGDWAVKLGINLFYSANLSRSPLYSKQMPYNSVIYSAFGRSSPATSPTKLNVYGRRSGKPKKVVAGKWCGRVWMSNQVHPFLAQRDPEEQEKERVNNGWATQDDNHERQSERIRKTQTTKVAGKFVRKRKMRTECGSIKKAKYIETEYAISDNSLDDEPHKQNQRIRRGKQPKLIEREAISYDSPEDVSHPQSRTVSRRNQAKCIEREDGESDDAIGDYTLKQHRMNLRGRQAKCMERDDEVSDGSLEGNSHKQHRIPRRRQAKFIERDDAVSDDEQEEDYHQKRRRVPRGKQIKSTQRDDPVSDDSLEDNSLKQHSRIQRGKQAKFTDADSDDSLAGTSLKWRRSIPKGRRAKSIQRDNAVSDDSLGDNSLMRCRRMPKSKQAKFVEREDPTMNDALEDERHQPLRRMTRGKQMKGIERDDVSSDDSLEDNSELQNRRIPRSKMTKFTDSEDAFSYDSLEGDSYQQQRSVPRSKPTKSFETEDAVSYDSLEDNSHEQLRRTTSKQSKCVEREYVVSYDSLEDASHQQLKKFPGSKQNKFIEREDAVSYDSLEENSHQQHGRTLRSRKKKPPVARQLKQVPRNVKQGKSQAKKRVKQETPRNHTNKIELSARQSDSYAEEELEGGPSTRLRKRVQKPQKALEAKQKEKKQAGKKKVKNTSAAKASSGRSSAKVVDEEADYQCDMDGCTMSFNLKQELALHKRNICPVKGCGKKFFSHKYLVQHRRVHMDDRPLKCPWKGCKMTFKWAWARTEHIRVHTGARPYVCAEEGCGQTFRFVSDFSRHKRKTGHSSKKGRG